MTDKVKKLPYTIEAADVPFDITEMQPQLFVTPDFRHLIKVLNEFADTMALRVGGAEGLEKAIECKNVTTAKYSSGLQVSGVFTNYFKDGNGLPVYIQTTGPTQLSYFGKELTGHDKAYHKDGFGSPIGKLKGQSKPIEQMTEGDFESLGVISGNTVELEFESGVLVSGFINTIRKDIYGKALIISFKDCRVTYQGKELFNPSWGIYDMAVGEQIDSVFAGPADITAFELPVYIPKETTQKIDYTKEELRLHELYQQVRQVREGKIDKKELKSIWLELQQNFPADWLLPMEILELVKEDLAYADVKQEIQAMLKHKAAAEKAAAEKAHISRSIVAYPTTKRGRSSKNSSRAIDLRESY